MIEVVSCLLSVMSSLSLVRCVASSALYWESSERPAPFVPVAANAQGAVLKHKIPASAIILISFIDLFIFFTSVIFFWFIYTASRAAVLFIADDCIIAVFEAAKYGNNVAKQ